MPKSSPLKFRVVLFHLLFAVFAYVSMRLTLPKHKMMAMMFVCFAIVDLWIEFWLRKNNKNLRLRQFSFYFLYGFHCVSIALFATFLIVHIFHNLAFWSAFWRTYFLGLLLVLYSCKIIFAGSTFIQFILSLFFKNKTITSPKLWQRLGILGCIACLFLMAYTSAISVFNLKVNRISIDDKAIPVSFDKYKIVMFSDLHIGSQIETKYVQTMVDSILKEDADLILFGGDMVNFDSREIDQFIPILSQLHARDGVFCIRGNHDYSSYLYWDSPADSLANVMHLENSFKQMGWTLLKNEGVFIHRGEDSIRLLGVEHYSKDKSKRFKSLAVVEEALLQGNPDDFTILLTHNPEHFTYEINPKHPEINLTLSGHTHGGQVGIRLGRQKISPAQINLKHWIGYYNEDGQHLFVTVGSGFNAYPFRIGVLPEVVVVELNLIN